MRLKSTTVKLIMLHCPAVSNGGPNEYKTFSLLLLLSDTTSASTYNGQLRLSGGTTKSQVIINRGERGGREREGEGEKEKGYTYCIILIYSLLFTGSG